MSFFAGQITARYLMRMYYYFLIDSETVHIIGHSLGAHVAGYVGKYFLEYTGRKVKRITGLDPAAPIFNRDSTTCDQRLCAYDAQVVDVLHTNRNVMGFNEPIGQIDFIANGGYLQPGCPDYNINTFSDLINFNCEYLLFILEVLVSRK